MVGRTRGTCRLFGGSTSGYLQMKGHKGGTVEKYTRVVSAGRNCSDVEVYAGRKRANTGDRNMNRIMVAGVSPTSVGASCHENRQNS